MTTNDYFAGFEVQLYQQASRTEGGRWLVQVSYRNQILATLPPELATEAVEQTVGRLALNAARGLLR